MNNPRITFKDMIIDGKYQKKWFKIFDLLDEIFSDNEKEKMGITYDTVMIQNFNLQTKELPIGTTKREFADFVAGVSVENKVLEVDIKTGTVTHFLKKQSN